VRRCVVLLYSNNYSCIIITTTDITLADTKRKPANWTDLWFSTAKPHYSIVGLAELLLVTSLNHISVVRSRRIRFVRQVVSIPVPHIIITRLDDWRNDVVLYIARVRAFRHPNRGWVWLDWRILADGFFCQQRLAFLV
jgi:hypothetical protein